MTSRKVIIHNYNMKIPDKILGLGDSIIYDCSDNEHYCFEIENEIIYTENVGHSLANFFQYIISNYDSLPNTVLFIKSNILLRHCDINFFDRKVKNNVYTGLYNDCEYKGRYGSSIIVEQGLMLEWVDNSNFNTRPTKYFSTYQSFIKYIFPTVHSNLEFASYAPGGCYLVESKRIRKYTKDFWINLKFLVSYSFFTGEAYIVERALHFIFTTEFLVNDRFSSVDKFKSDLPLLIEKCSFDKKQERTIFNRIKRFFIRVVNIIISGSY